MTLSASGPLPLCRSNVVAHIRNRYPRSLLFAAGWSLGANIMTRYLGKAACWGAAALMHSRAIRCFSHLRCACFALCLLCACFALLPSRPASAAATL